MITKLVLTVPAAAFALLTLAAGAVATSDSAEARRQEPCYRGLCPGGPPIAPKPDRPNQPLK